jgi:hypothetical protein
MKITNLKSSKGNAVPNQFTIETDNAIYFQSYESIIAKIENQIIYLDSKFWNYSRTTTTYLNQFLREKKEQTEKKIKDGVYILTNLN